MLKGFGAFIARGNVIDLAVAVIVGAAFTAVINALVKDVITPFIAAIVGKPNFSSLGFTLHHSHFPIGDFVNALVTFVIDAAVIYFFVVVPMQRITARFAAPPDDAPVMKECPECLSEIPAAARRCRACTAVLSPA